MGKLLDVVRGMFAFADVLQSSGVQDDVTVRLSRRDGEALMKLITGVDGATSENPPDQAPEISSTGQFRRIRIAGVCFEWPKRAHVKKMAELTLIEQFKNRDSSDQLMPKKKA